MILSGLLPLRKLAKMGTLLCLVSFLACSSDHLSGLETANELLYQKKYVEAELSYRKLLKRLNNTQNRSESQEIQRMVILDRLGQLSTLYLRNYRQALTDLELLVNDYPKSDPALAAHLMMADIHRHKLNQPEQALDQLNHAIENFPWRPETRRTLLELTTLYIELKNYEQARTEGQALIDKWPQSTEAREAYFLIANSYYIQDRFSEAIQIYQEILKGESSPSLNALVNFELASCYQELGDYKQALELYYQTLSDHPNPVLVQRNIKRVRSRVRESGAHPTIYRATPYNKGRSQSARTSTARSQNRSKAKSTKPSNKTQKPPAAAKAVAPKPAAKPAPAAQTAPAATKPTTKPAPAAPKQAPKSVPKPPAAPKTAPKPAASQESAPQTP